MFRTLTLLSLILGLEIALTAQDIETHEYFLGQHN